MADYFTSLADDMASAYKDRTNSIATIQRETARLIREFEKEDKERADVVAKLLADFDKAHAEMAAATRAELAEVKPKLADAEKGRSKRDQAEIKQRETEVAALLKQFDEEHAKMSGALLSMLAKEEKERRETSQAENRERASQWQAAVRKMAGVRGEKVAKAPAEE